MTPFNAVGLELWSMTSDILFDNFIICADRAVADDWGNDGWGLKKAADGAAEVRKKSLFFLIVQHKIEFRNSSFFCSIKQIDVYFSL